MTQERAIHWAACPQLYITEAGRPARAIALANTMTIGRDNQNDIVLESLTVSRCHAVLLCDATGVRLIDLESTNGTCVNGVPVTSDEPVALNDGTIIQLGQVRARYYEPTSSNSYIGPPKLELSTANHIFEPSSLDDRQWTMDDARPSMVHRQKPERFCDSIHLA